MAAGVLCGIRWAEKEAVDREGAGSELEYLRCPLLIGHLGAIGVAVQFLEDEVRGRVRHVSGDWKANCCSVERIYKVATGNADESSGKRGSFHKVTRGRRSAQAFRSGTRSGNSLDQFNRNKENLHGIGCPE